MGSRRTRSPGEPGALRPRGGPDGARDLASQRPTATLELALDAIVRRDGRQKPGGSTPLEDEETRRALQALGYLE